MNHSSNTSAPQGKEQLEQIETIITLLSSVKEVLSASFRCPLLFSEFVEHHLAYDQRECLVRFHKEFKERVEDPVAPLSPVLQRRVSYRKKSGSGAGEANNNNNNMGAAQSPPTSPLSSPRNSSGGGGGGASFGSGSGDANSGNNFTPLPPSSLLSTGGGGSSGAAASTSAHLLRRQSLAASPLAAADDAPPSLPSVCVKAYQAAILGIADIPNDLESYPRPLQPGLLHGEVFLLEKFFGSYPKILEFFVERLEKDLDTYEAISEANMLWLGKHPTDYEMAGRENAKWQALSETSGSGAKRKDLAHKMRHLLLLNLQLHHPPDEWVELLSVRDRLIDLFHRAGQEVPTANNKEVEDTLCQLELACTGLELIRIDSNPQDVKELLLNKSNQVYKSINKVLVSYQKNTSSSGFFTKMSAESQQLKSVVGMLKRVLGDLSEEISQIEGGEELIAQGQGAIPEQNVRNSNGSS